MHNATDSLEMFIVVTSIFLRNNRHRHPIVLEQIQEPEIVPLLQGATLGEATIR